VGFVFYIVAFPKIPNFQLPSYMIGIKKKAIYIVNIYTMIKNWEMFLESFGDDSERNRAKKEILGTLKDIIDSEQSFRENLSIKQIDSFLTNFLNQLIDTLSVRLKESEKIPEENSNILYENFKRLIELNKTVMIEESFEIGLSNIVDGILDSIEEFRELSNKEDSSWRDPKEVEYENMQKTDIQDLIDDALDRRDFDEVKKLSRYLESNNLNVDFYMIINEFINELMNVIL